MFRNRFAVAVTALLALSTAAGAGISAPVEQALVGPDVGARIARTGQARVIVAFRHSPSSRTRSLASLSEEAVATRSRVLHRLGPSSGFTPTARWNAVAAMPGLVTRTGLARLARDPDVSRIDLDLPGRAADAESLPLIGGDVAHSQGYTGKGITVAVVDSGVDRTHPDLSDAVVAEHCFVIPSGCPNGGSEQDGTGSARDDNGHGTNVAGIIVSDGRVAPIGVAPDASLVAVRVLDSSGRFQTTSQLISALNWIALNHPEVRAVNLSLGTDRLFTGTCDDALADTMALSSAVAALRARGTSVFASAGNQASPSSMAAPACLQGVVAVGAVYDSSVGAVTFPGICTDTSTAARQVTCFSNSGPALDLLAPGAIITATGRGGGTSSYIGTSQASPHATGSAALLLQRNGSLTPDQVEAALKSTGSPVTDARNGMTTPLLDVAAALAQVSGGPPPPAPPPTDTTPPVVRARAGTYRSGKTTPLVLSLRDDSGQARVVETVYGAHKRVLKTIRSGFASTAKGTRSFAWRAPKTAVGTLQHCARAFDRAGNASATSCARLLRR